MSERRPAPQTHSEQSSTVSEGAAETMAAARNERRPAPQTRSEQSDTVSDRPAVLDTSVLIARETGRSVDIERLPDQTTITVVTVAELHAGVLAAADTATRARRLATVDAISAVEALPITVEAARRWAELRVRLAEEGRRAKINDLWIAAVASANDMDVVTQDDDFDVIAEVGGPTVIKV